MEYSAKLKNLSAAERILYIHDLTKDGVSLDLILESIIADDDLALYKFYAKQYLDMLDGAVLGLCVKHRASNILIYLESCNQAWFNIKNDYNITSVILTAIDELDYSDILAFSSLTGILFRAYKHTGVTNAILDLYKAFMIRCIKNKKYFFLNTFHNHVRGLFEDKVGDLALDKLLKNYMSEEELQNYNENYRLDI